MKKIILAALTLIVTLFLHGNIIAQVKGRTEIATVKQKGETIRFTLMSSKPFIYGDNRYLLHIGDKDFSRYVQAKNEGRGYITFLIPQDDFNKLANGKNIYLTYGSVSEDADMEALAANSARCWSLGEFNKYLLTK